MSRKFIFAAFGTNAIIDNEGRRAIPPGSIVFSPGLVPSRAQQTYPTANTDDFTKPLAEAVAQEKKMYWESYAECTH